MTTSTPTVAVTDSDDSNGIRVIDAGHGRAIHFVPKGVDPLPAVSAVREAAAERGVLAFDVETTAGWLSDKKYNYMTSMQVGTESVAMLLDPWDRTHRAVMSELLNNEQYRIVAHNASFDVLMLTQVGIFKSVAVAYERLTDTMVLARLLAAGDNTPVGLKPTTAAICGADAVSADARDDLKKVQKKMGTKGVGSAFWSAYKAVSVDSEGNVEGDLRAGNTWALIPRDNDAWITYCAGDIFDAAALHEKLAPVITAMYPDQVVKEHRIERIVAAMAHRGVGFDKVRAVELLGLKWDIRDTAATKLSELGVDVSEASQLVKTASGATTRMSRDELVAAAIREEGVEVPRKRTKDGQWVPELDKSSLKKYAAAGSKVAPIFREWRKVDKEIQTYLVPYLKVRADRIHADISTGAARTGRMTSAKPNVQNVPEDVKPCFVADEGMVFISADFSSIEMRVAAAVTGDPKLVGMYTDPLPDNATERQVKARDPYWETAWAVWGDDATAQQRKLAKIIVLGSMYGGGADALAANVDIPVAEAQRILKGYKSAFPQLGEWWKANMNDRIYTGRSFWTLETGRFQTIDPTRAWAGFNLMIQGTARDLLLDAMFRLDDAGFGEYMLLPIHDEVLFQVPADQAGELVKRITEAMETVFMGVPITAEAKVLGDRWIEKTEVQKPSK